MTAIKQRLNTSIESFKKNQEIAQRKKEEQLRLEIAKLNADAKKNNANANNNECK
jgi:hypothetical protein